MGFLIQKKQCINSKGNDYHIIYKVRNKSNWHADKVIFTHQFQENLHYNRIGLHKRFKRVVLQ